MYELPNYLNLSGTFLFVKEIKNEVSFTQDKNYINSFIQAIEDPTIRTRFQLSVRKFKNYICCTMPILNYSYGRSHLIYRIFIINQGATNIAKINFVVSPDLKLKNLLSYNWKIAPSTMMFIDVTIDSKEILQRIIKSEMVYFLFIELHGKKEKVGESFSSALICSPVYKVEKPKTIQQLAESDFLGIASKTYIHIDQTNTILYQTMARLSLIRIIGLILFASTVIFLIVAIQMLIEEFRYSLTKKEQKALQLMPEYLQNPSEEWRQLIAKKRELAMQAFERTIEPKKQELLFKEELKKNKILIKELLIPGKGILSVILYPTIIPYQNEIKLYVAFYNFRNKRTKIRFRLSVQNLEKTQYQKIALQAPANGFVTREILIKKPVLLVLRSEATIRFELGVGKTEVKQLSTSLRNLLLFLMECTCYLAMCLSFGCVVYRKDFGSGVGGKNAEQYYSIPITFQEAMLCERCMKGQMRFDQTTSKWICQSCQQTIPNIDLGFITNYFNKQAEKYYSSKLAWLEAECPELIIKVW